MLNSGNADLDAIKYGPGLANQEYGNWQTKLAGLINPELSATSGAATGMAGNARDISALYSNDALARLGLEQGVTQGQAGVNTGLAQNQVALGNSLSGVYGQDAANRVGIQSGITTGGISANNTQAAGEAAGAKNLLGAGMNLASMAAGLPPGTFTNMFGGGSSGSGAALGSMNIGGKLYPKFEQA
jgi:hypothetical protein